MAYKKEPIRLRLAKKMLNGPIALAPLYPAYDVQYDHALRYHQHGWKNPVQSPDRHIRPAQALALRPGGIPADRRRPSQIRPDESIPLIQPALIQ
jgi:hypothetical protein